MCDNKPLVLVSKRSLSSAFSLVLFRIDTKFWASVIVVREIATCSTRCTDSHWQYTWTNCVASDIPWVNPINIKLQPSRAAFHTEPWTQHQFMTNSCWAQCLWSHFCFNFGHGDHGLQAPMQAHWFGDTLVQRIVLSSLLLQYLLVIWKWDGITVSFFQFCLEYFFSDFMFDCFCLCVCFFSYFFASLHLCFSTSSLLCYFAFALFCFFASLPLCLFAFPCFFFLFLLFSLNDCKALK